MFSLAMMTLATSAADSLNPIAIAQQLVFQSVSRKKQDIVGFIIGIGFTNFAAGLLVYYGLAALAQQFLGQLLSQYPVIIPAGEIVIGAVLLLYLVKRLFSQKVETEEVKRPDKKLGFGNLLGLGFISCCLELSSALPYFAFLAILLQYQLPVIGVVAILAVYNVIYSMPLIVIYICSLYFSDHLDRFYHKFSVWMSYILTKVIPVILLLIGLVLLVHGIFSIIHL